MTEINWNWLNNVSSLSNRQHPFQSHNLLHDKIPVTCAWGNGHVICIIHKQLLNSILSKSVNTLKSERKYSKIFTRTIILHIVKYFYENPLICHGICLHFVNFVIYYFYTSNNKRLSWELSKNKDITKIFRKHLFTNQPSLYSKFVV